ncbi:hypothetical protein ACFE04_008497 [Oxalis oulophora]
MASNNRGSELDDPLSDYSGLSLFPRTLSKPNLADLHDAHTFLRSMPITNPSRFLEEAKFIVDSHEVGNAALTHKDNRERRPGLGRKRARFSFIPDSTQPTVNLEPTLDVSKLKDPEEFFSAFDRLQNAKIELQKHSRSALTEIDENILFTVAPRPRREGISGRTVKPKHSYSFSQPSQDTIVEEDPSPHVQSPQKETTHANHESEKMDLDGSTKKSKNKESELLDELLNGSDEELDGDNAVNVLRERLQIKSFDLEKLRLPDLGEVRKMDLKTLVGNPPKPKKSLSDMYSSLKGGVSINKTPLKLTNAEILESPSPLVSISVLKKRILQSNSSLAPDMDLSPQRDATPIQNTNQESEWVETEMVSSVLRDLKSPMIEEDEPNVATMGSDVGASGSHIGVEDNAEDPGMDEVVNEENTEDACVDHGVLNGDNAKDAVVDQSIPTVTEDHAMDGCSNMVDNVPENYIQQQKVQEPTRVSLKERRKQVSRPSKIPKSKQQSRRDSLAASGMVFENGARRSTRIRSRPLEYWKGERFLYGRVHESLPTVIGIKYESPAKVDAQPTFKVKSYVADNYKELVDLAALH